jgi:arsenical pump membrane protein
MWWFLGIAAAAVIGMFILIIFCPKVKIGKFQVSIFWLPPFLGAVVLVSAGLIDAKALFENLTASASINPFFILILFFSMTLISIVLDETGFFRYLAQKVASKSSASQTKLFIGLYALISILTIFTSNDIIILTFTPFIMSFCKNTKIDPLPYLVSEFVAANTWSIALLIGNPTNIYLGTAFNIGFFRYIQVMLLPTFLAGVTSFFIMGALFYKKLQTPLTASPAPAEKPEKRLVLPSLICLIICIVLLSISQFIHFQMWMVSAVSAIVLIVYYAIYGGFNLKARAALTNGIKRLPYELIPFVLSMFILAFGMKEFKLSDYMASWLGETDPVFRYGLTSFLTCNIINNIPMSVFFTEIISSASASVQLPAVYASIIGSNIGAFLTPIGALAGIMWMSIIKNYKYNFGFGRFSFYGFIVSIPAICAALGGLMLSLHI